jgi:osmotically-inducible protein OsmY
MLLRIVGCLLASAIFLPTPSASAQLLGGLFRRPQTTVRNGRYEMSNMLSSEHQRLTELQVELALLSDIATFPFEFLAQANGNTFELKGNVPNDFIRQRAMDLARRTTVLRGIDGLRIQPKLSVQSTLRPTNVVQQEGIELLHKELGGQARHIGLEVRPNGMVVLSGHIDSVEGKVEISKLFRQLPGCTAVINELMIEPVMLDGQRMVRVTRNNMLLVPPSVLGQDQDAVIDETPIPVPENKKHQTIDQQIILPPPQKSTTPPLVPLRTSNLDAREVELHLPTAVAMKQPSTPAKSAPEKIGDDWESFAPSKLPVKWGNPSGSWEAQAKDLEAIHSPPAEKAQTARKQTPKPPQPQSKPAELEWTTQPAQPQDKLPVPIRYVGRADESSKTKASSTASKKSRASTRSGPNFAETRETPESALAWRRPGGSEESEPKNSVPTKDLPQRTDNDVSTKTAPSTGLTVQSSRRWPSAYVTGPPPSKGRPGVIVFDEDPPAPSKPKAQPNATPATSSTARPMAAAELQRQIKSLCGRQAREVVAAVQHDGTVLVRVKVANRSIEDQLSRKILSLPEMTSPRVKLLMEIEQ